MTDPTIELPQETVLTLYLDAKLAQAELDSKQASELQRSHPGPYAGQRALWLKHKLAAIRELRRDADRPGQIIARYLKARDRDRGIP